MHPRPKPKTDQKLTQDDLHVDFRDGFLPEQFNILLQKGSEMNNVQLVEDVHVGNKKQNVLRLHARSNNNYTTGAIVQTAGWFGSGFFEIKVQYIHTENNRKTRDETRRDDTGVVGFCIW